MAQSGMSPSDLIYELKRLRDGDHECWLYRKEWLELKLSAKTYEKVLTELEQGKDLEYFFKHKLSYDYDRHDKSFVIRKYGTMHSPSYTFFVGKIENEVASQLMKSSWSGTSEVRVFAEGIRHKSRLYGRKLSYTVGHGSSDMKSPDTYFQRQGAKYPGVIVEIAFNTSDKNLDKLAMDYFKRSTGKTKVVLCIHCNGKFQERQKDPNVEWVSEKAVVTMWRSTDMFDDVGARQSHPVPSLERIFRRENGKPVENHNIVINLEDFAHQKVGGRLGGRPVTLSTTQLFNWLRSAELIEQSELKSEESSNELDEVDTSDPSSSEDDASD